MKSSLEAKTGAVKEALKSDDTEAVRAAMSDLEKTMGELMAAAQQAAPTGTTLVQSAAP